MLVTGSLSLLIRPLNTINLACEQAFVFEFSFTTLFWSNLPITLLAAANGKSYGNPRGTSFWIEEFLLLMVLILYAEVSSLIINCYWFFFMEGLWNSLKTAMHSSWKLKHWKWKKGYVLWKNKCLKKKRKESEFWLLIIHGVLFKSLITLPFTFW